jgi:hypothetical protein
MVNIKYLISTLKDFVFNNLRIYTIKVSPNFYNLLAHFHFDILISFCRRKIPF